MRNSCRRNWKIEKGIRTHQIIQVQIRWVAHATLTPVRFMGCLDLSGSEPLHIPLDGIHHHDAVILFTKIDVRESFRALLEVHFSLIIIKSFDVDDEDLVDMVVGDGVQFIQLTEREDVTKAVALEPSFEVPQERSICGLLLGTTDPPRYCRT